MTFFERMPVPAHEEESGGEAKHTFEARTLEAPARLLERYTGDSTLLALKGVQARAQIESLAGDKSPEEVAQLREKLSALIREAQITLDKLASTTALSSTLTELAEGQEPATNPLGITEEDLATNPELAQKILEGVVVVGESTERNDLASKSLATEAQTVLKEMRIQKHAGKIALTVAERIFKIVLDANTFGFGGAAYDTIKDLVHAFKTRNKTVTA